MSLLTTVLSFLVMIGILVVVHEYGHYLAARLSGVKVLKFSVGFGKPLISRRLGQDQTEWVVSALPLGGYVKMLDEREGDVAREEAHRAFNRATVWRRMAIVIAGPLANFLLAVIVFWALFIHGVPALKPVVGEPDQQTPAAQAGLRNGDEIVSVNGQRVETFADLQMALLESAVNKEKAAVELANGEQRELDFSLVETGDMEDSAKSLGIVPFTPDLAPVVGRLEPGGVAEKSGLKPGDRILAVNGKAIQTWQDFSKQVRAFPDKEIEVALESGQTSRSIRMTPARASDKGTEIGRVGAGPKVDPALFEALRTEQRYGPVLALGQAMIKTWDTTVFSLKMLGRMVIGQVSWRNLSGPISIADYAGQTAQQGWLSFFGFLAVISIGLGVINLLPIPLLDGGHLMYYIFEVFRGRPVSERVLDIGARIGMAMLGTLIFMALYNDILRVLTR
jgi:regulator of sigma E protease